MHSSRMSLFGHSFYFHVLQQISSNIRRAIGRGNQHTAVLAIFPVLRHLRAIRPEFATVLEVCTTDQCVIS